MLQQTVNYFYMNKKKLYIIDYNGLSSIKNEPLGHSLKVVKELSVIFTNNNIDTSIIVPKNYKPFYYDVDIPKVYLNHSMIDSKRLLYKISNAFKKMQNILSLYLKTDANSILYFVVSDIYLYFFVWLFPKKMFPRFIILTKYSNNIETLKQKIFNAFFKKIDHKIDLRIVSNEKLLNSKSNSMFMPDYFYNKKYYSKYIPLEKNEEVVCLGVMREYDKDLKNLVKAFVGIEYRLKIIGHFTENTLYQTLFVLAKDNNLITIENRLLTDEEYYKYLANAKYSIMPYKVNMYCQRTSGVLLESVFLNTIPICHHSLLDFNNINGIPYSQFEDLKKIDFKGTGYSEILAANNKLKIRYDSVFIIDEFIKKTTFK
jgi:hypothetical protein